MLYLRSDATEGPNGGYHYDGRGIMRKLPVSPDFKVRLRLDVKQGGGSNSQFYLLDIGSCWKNDGKPCDGNVLTDVTRYSEMIINPATTNWCRPDDLVSCPPYHVTKGGDRIYRNETSRFPYAAYHLYCAPGNAKYLEKPNMIYVTHIATHKHKSWYKFFPTLSGLYMAILKRKEMDGLEIPGHGSLMLVHSPAGRISTRTQEQNQQREYGLHLMWVQKYMSVTQVARFNSIYPGGLA